MAGRLKRKAVTARTANLAEMTKQYTAANNFTKNNIQDTTQDMIDSVAEDVTETENIHWDENVVVEIVKQENLLSDDNLDDVATVLQLEPAENITLKDVMKEILAVKAMVIHQGQKLDYLIAAHKKMTRRREMPSKPNYLPIKDEKGLQNTQNLDADEYEALVEYYEHISGTEILDSINSMVKESFTDEFAYGITLTGKGNTINLSDKNIVKAMFAAGEHKPWRRPDASLFAGAISDAIRNAKQRYRGQMKAAGDNDGAKKGRFSTAQFADFLNN